MPRVSLAGRELPDAAVRLLKAGRRRLRPRGIGAAKPVRVSNSRSIRPTIYFYQLDDDTPIGGHKVIYRHVEALCNSGFSAVALHQKQGFRYTWFDHNVPVASVTDAAICHGDLLVVPEILVSVIAQGSPVPRHVVLNQNPYFTWAEDAVTVSQHYLSPRRPAAIISTSEFTTEFARFSFRGMDIHEVRLSINPDLFRPSDGEEPPPRIVYMPRKGSVDADMTLRMLDERGALRGWDVRSLDGLREERVANELRSARVFLAVSPREGLGLPPLEAMAAGCYVVGYHATGGKEYMRPEFCSPVESGDICGLAHELERVVALDAASPGWLRERGLQSARFVHERYRPERERSDLIRVYSDLLGGTPPVTPWP